MSKFKMSVLILPLIFLISACQVDDSEGKIVVTNYSEEENDVITAVYAKLENEDAYILRWSSSDGAKFLEDAAFYVEEGKYDVRVYVRKSADLFPYYYETYFETGYKNPVKVEEDEFSFVNYDGKGIYQ